MPTISALFVLTPATHATLMVLVPPAPLPTVRPLSLPDKLVSCVTTPGALLAAALMLEPALNALLVGLSLTMPVWPA